MESRFKKVLKGSFLTSIMATSSAEVSSYDIDKFKQIDKGEPELNTKQDNSQKFVLKIQNDNPYLIAGLRSHHSHSLTDRIPHTGPAVQAIQVVVHHPEHRHIQFPHQQIQEFPPDTQEQARQRHLQAIRIKHNNIYYCWGRKHGNVIYYSFNLLCSYI